MKGAEKSRNGIRRPRGPRCLSLMVDMTGFSVKLMMLGTVVRMIGSTESGAFSSRSRRGTIWPFTYSITVKQKSPQSSHTNTHSSPAIV